MCPLFLLLILGGVIAGIWNIEKTKY
jgi:hypothetical protein